MGGVPAPRATNEPLDPERDTIAEDVGLLKPLPKEQSLDAPSDALMGAAAVPAPSRPKNPLQPYFFEPDLSVMPKPATPAPVRDDVAKILSEVKLPERRPAPQKPPAEAPVPPPQPKAEAAVTPPSVGAPAGQSPLSGATDSLPSVHTLKQDLLGVVRDQKISLVRAAALESEKKRPVQEPIELAVGKKHNFGMLFAALLLFFLGAGALAGVYFVMTAKARAPQALDENALVFAERTIAFPLDGGPPLSVRSTLAQARTASGALGSILHIIPTVPGGGAGGGESGVRPATTAEFFRAIGAKPPDELLRSVDTNFFLGIHIVDENVPLLVRPVTSYDRAFAAMLDWERGISAELAPIYQQMPALTSQGGIPTDRTFTDIVMRNYDVRALRDDSGIVQLYYSFPTRDILIIAESPYSFTEILSRLQAKRRL